MPIAVVAFDFDPVIRYGDIAIRLETLVLAGAVLAALIVAALIVRRVPRLRVDDLVLLVLAVIPGAVAGGRLGYALLHLDYYLARPAAILDPGQGSLELTGAVLGGLVSGTYAARLIGESVAAWRDVAAVPMLLGIALGKVAIALGGRGQGTPSDLPWATAYAGPGPWGSLGPAIPSHPSQLYEAIATALVLVAVVAVLLRRRPGDGRTFLAALAGWALVRVVVAATWRDDPVVGPVLAEQLICLGVVLGCLLAASGVTTRRMLVDRGIRPAAEPEPDPRPPA